MATPPQIDYSKYIFKGGPTGYWTLIGGTARPVLDPQSIPPDVKATLRSKGFGEDSAGYDPGGPNGDRRGGGTTGGGQTFASLPANIYAMDSQYREALDAYNTATNPSVTGPGPQSGGATFGAPTETATSTAATGKYAEYGTMNSSQFANAFEQQNGHPPTQAEMQEFVASRSLTPAGTTTDTRSLTPTGTGAGSATGANSLTAGTPGSSGDPWADLLNVVADQLTNKPPTPENGAIEVNISKYLEDAKKELSPYYQQLVSQAQTDLTRGFQQIGEDLVAGERAIGQKYGASLESTQEQMARRGLTNSSIRDKAEMTLAEQTQQAIEAGRVEAQRRATELGTKGERYLGTKQMPTLPGIGNAPVPTLGRPGVYGLTDRPGDRTLFAPVGNTFGTLEGEQLTAEQKRARELGTARQELQANYTI